MTLGMDIRTGERRVVATAFLALFFFMIGHALLETARDALFLEALPATQLPFAYLAIAVVSYVVTVVIRQFQASDKRVLLVALFVAILGASVLWLIWPKMGSEKFYVLYVWTGTVATVVVLQFWLYMGSRFPSGQAKRVFPGIGAGAIVGASMGSFASGALSSWISASQLLVLVVVPFAVSIGCVIWIPEGDTTTARPKLNTSTKSRLSLYSRYTRSMVLLALIGTVALTCADYLFKSSMAHHVAPGDLARWFGLTYGVIGLGALGIQLLVAPILLRSVGVIRSAALLPILLVGLGLVGALFPVVVVALLIKAVDGSLKHSVYNTSFELMVLPLGEHQRKATKRLVDVFGKRGGQALGSIVLLLLTYYTSHAATVAVLLATVTVGWLVLIGTLRSPYLGLFRDRLVRGEMRSDVGLLPVDLHQLEAMIRTLNSDEPSEVIAAMELLDFHDRSHLIPALILYHPDRYVVLKALDIFVKHKRSDFSKIALTLMYNNDDDEVRAAAIRAKSAVDPEEDRLREFIKDSSDLVRATALVAMTTNNLAQSEDTTAMLHAIVASGTIRGKIALAQAIRDQPDERLLPVLPPLLKTKNQRLTIMAIWAVEKNPSLQLLPSLIPALAPASTRSYARRAILSIGPAAIESLDKILANDATPLQIRRHIPRTISRFIEQDSVDILTKHLRLQSDGMIRYKALRGLGRLVTQLPTATIDTKTIQKTLHANLMRIGRLLGWKAVFDDSPHKGIGMELLVDLLADKIENAVERVFRLVALLYRKSDLEDIFVSARSPSRGVRDSALELISAWEASPAKQVVLAVLDDLPARSMISRIPSRYRHSAGGLQQAIEECLQDGSVPVRSLAAYIVGEYKLYPLQDVLEGQSREETSFVKQVMVTSLRNLSADTKQDTA